MAAGRSGGQNLGKNRRRATNSVEDKMIDGLDKLEIFEELNQVVLPQLQRLLAKGYTHKEILKEFQALAAAKLVTSLITEKDSSKILGLVKEVNDRLDGKAVSPTEVKHKFENLPDDQLDSLLESRLVEAGLVTATDDDDTKNSIN